MSYHLSTLSVSQLNRAIAQLLTDYFATVWVEGELSNLSFPSSGHLYFSLKDQQAQVRCALFRQQQIKLNFKPTNGQQVTIKAKVSLYEPRGDYQLIVESMELAGDGRLRLAFETLKNKLLTEGLFDKTHKQALPSLPRTIGVITSASGAALHDILTVLKRRFRAIPIIIYPTSVQGEQAKYEIVKTITLANQRQECDVLILGRGGGSLEDLWAFNEEMVARAIFASRIPIISAVGHETDSTIADFVADFRAATPSAAAELASPDQQQWLIRFMQLEQRLSQYLQQRLQQQYQTLDWLSKRLAQQSVVKRLEHNQQRLTILEQRLNQIIQHKLEQHKQSLAVKNAKLWQHHPNSKIHRYQQRQQHLQHRLNLSIQQQLKQKQQHLATLSQTLQAISPLATLNRGYALSLNPLGQILRDTKELKQGDIIETRLAAGSFYSEVKKIIC